MRSLSIICLILFFQTGQHAENNFPHTVDLLDLKGEKFNSSNIDNNNQFLIIDFWNISCGSCIMTFDAIADNFDDWNTNTNFKIIAIAAQTRNQRIVNFINERNWPFEVYFDEDYDLFRTLLKNHNKSQTINFSFPTIFVFNKKMQMIDKIVGAKTKPKDGVEFLPRSDGAQYTDYFETDLQFYYDLSDKLKSL